MAVATAGLGIVAATAGRILAGLGGWTAYAIAALPLAMGAHLLGWVRLPMPSSHVRGDHRGAAGAFVAGLLIWLVLAPCATPVLAAVLSYAAYEGSVAYGGVLLVLYGLGAGVPLLALGTAAGRLAQRLDALGWRRRVDAGTGTVLLGLGFYLVWVA
jgi:cytochrome c biogenesis protein CcdA